MKFLRATHEFITGLEQRIIFVSKKVVFFPCRHNTKKLKT